MSTTIRETLHHGATFAQVDSTGATLEEALERLLMGERAEQGLYTYNVFNATDALLPSLRETGRGDWAWSRFELVNVDTASSASRQHWIETGRYLTTDEVAEYATTKEG